METNVSQYKGQWNTFKKYSIYAMNIFSHRMIEAAYTSNCSQSSLSLVGMGPQRKSFFVEVSLLWLYVPLIFWESLELRTRLGTWWRNLQDLLRNAIKQHTKKGSLLVLWTGWHFRCYKPEHWHAGSFGGEWPLVPCVGRHRLAITSWFYLWKIVS